MMEAYLDNLSFGEKKYLKELLLAGFPDEEIDLNTMSFTLDKDRNVVVVGGLIVGDEIDGLEYDLPEFMDMVHAALADVPVYYTEAAKVNALRHYLAELSTKEQQQLRRQLSTFTSGSGHAMEVGPLEFLYDDERTYVVVNVRAARRKIDQFEVSLGDFVVVVREVVG